MKKKPVIIVGVTGSIAAYKACEIVRGGVKMGWDVSVILTPDAARFVTAATFRTLSRNPVAMEMFDTPETWNPAHISLAEAASLMVIAPCTANTLAKIALGLADNLLTCTALATRAPLLIAPAMNTGMWENPVTQGHVATLHGRGIAIIPPDTGDLACGAVGKGRMPAPATILAAIHERVKG
ncbi:MAG: hypothetical protein FWF84_07215 [Kiritimatiellaeota bacterium]|nr:hypothetical protein [Kiritimatiellota bacterium]